MTIIYGQDRADSGEKSDLKSKDFEAIIGHWGSLHEDYQLNPNASPMLRSL